MSFGETFLTMPDLFPARMAGEVWGEESIRLDLPAGGYEVLGISASQKGFLEERYDLLPKAGASQSVEVRLFKASLSEFRSFDLAGWDYSLDFDYERDSVRLAGLRFMGRLEWSPDLRCGLWTCEDGGGRFLELFENFLRVVSAYRLLESGGVLLHSAGIVSQDKAYLFYGRSGAGKSTLSRLSMEAGRNILSDDINVVFRVDDEPEVEAMPFAGDFAETGKPGVRFPLCGIYRLEKGDKERISPLSPAAALASLVACAPFVNRDPHRLDRVSRQLEALIERIPPRRLQFTLAGNPWTILESEE